MSIDDRDYMKARYHERRHLRWNDSKGRVEFDGDDVVARRYDAPRGRGSDTRRRNTVDPRVLLGGTAVLAICGLAWISLARAGGGAPFPASGSVTIARSLDPETAQASFRIRASTRDAVVQLLRPSGRHLMSIYIQCGDERTVPVPTGRFRLRVATGERWVGTDQLFGSGTRYRRAARDFVFSQRRGHFLEISGRIDGNLPMTPEWGSVPRP